MGPRSARSPCGQQVKNAVRPSSATPSGGTWPHERAWAHDRQGCGPAMPMGRVIRHDGDAVAECAQAGLRGVGTMLLFMIAGRWPVHGQLVGAMYGSTCSRPGPQLGLQGVGSRDGVARRRKCVDGHWVDKSDGVNCVTGTSSSRDPRHSRTDPTTETPWAPLSRLGRVNGQHPRRRSCRGCLLQLTRVRAGLR